MNECVPLQQYARGTSSHANTIWLTNLHVIMVALWNRADHYIFALWFLSFFLLSFFFLRLISAAADWMSTILRHIM